jgi:hypothetical protein
MRRVRSQFSRRRSLAALPLFLAVLATTPATAAAADGCPNAEFRAQQGSQHLTECRAYERVTDVEKFGSAATPNALSLDGSRVLLVGGGGWADTDGQDGLFNFFLSDREADRWTVTSQNLSRAAFMAPGRSLDGLPDLSRSLVLATTYDQLLAGSTQFYFKGADGSLRPASPVITRQAGGDQVSDWVAYGGAADDLSSYVFSVAANFPLLPGQATGLSGSSIYEVRDADTDTPTLRRVDLDTAGEEIGFACGRSVGGNGSTRNAVSGDGSTIFFSGNGAATSPTGCSAANRGPMAIYARVGGTTTVEISKSECDREAPLPACAPPATSGAARTAADSIYRGASDDGEVVWFITNRQLADSDTDETLDLYEYRATPGVGEPHLTQISAGDGTAGPIGSGATVLNTVRVAHDGRRAYFVAQGALTAGVNAAGQQATVGQPNLYLWERTAEHPEGRLRFVATLPGADSSLWANSDLSRPAVLPDREGRYLVFTSTAALTADDLDAARDAYRYDAQSGNIVRVSTGRDGYGDDGNAPTLGVSIRPEDNSLPGNRKVAGVTPDGSRILFFTSESLQAGDEPGTPDVYQWHDGEVSLVSSGRDASTQAFHFAISPDGATILFSGALPLVGDDTDTTVDLYAARTAGGFAPRSSVVPPPCVGDGCQPRGGPAPDLGGSGSRDYAGPGNVTDGSRSAFRPVKPKVRSPKAVRGSLKATLRVRVNGKGRVRASGVGLRRVSRSVRKAGTYKVVVVLSKKARATLRRKGRVSVVARVAYRPPGAKALTSKVRLTFERAKKGGR